MNVTTENFISIFEDAYSKEYCETVIKYFDAAIETGLGMSRQQQHKDVKKITKDDTQWYAHDEFSLHYSTKLLTHFNDVFWESIYPEYANKFDVLTTFAPHRNYAFKVQKTEVGQGYHVWHAENDSKNHGSRVLAWTLYLNDVEEGGETEFLYYPKRVKPKAGTFVIWPSGFTHTHRGNPPISNTKYIVTGWVEF